MFGKLFNREKTRTTPQQTLTMASLDGPGSNMEILQKVTPFCSTPESARILSMSFIERIEMRTNERLFEVGLSDEWDYYLIEGSVNLVASDGRESTIEQATPKAQTPLAYLRPRKYAVVVHSKYATFLRLPHTIVEQAYAQAKANHQWGQSETVYIGQVHQETLFEKVDAEIQQGTLLLPTLPEVAEKVRQACSNSDNSAAAITKIVAHDTAISAKLLAASNSPMYRGASEISTLHEAISRLGRDTTQHLVYYYATKELFQTPVPLLRKLFQSAWNKSLERAVVAHTIAKYGHEDLDPDIAFLCGLLFRIGDLVVFQYVADVEQDVNELSKIQTVAEEYSAKISRLLVRDWNLPEAVSQALKHGSHWRRTSGSDTPDYAELLVVTNIHLRMLHDNMNGLPDLNKVPAIARVLPQAAEQEVSLIAEAKKALAEFMDL